MDSALQLGQSAIRMAFTVSANIVFNTLSERIYSAEREVITTEIRCFYDFVLLQIIILVFIRQFQSCIEEIRNVEDKFSKSLADTVKKCSNNDDLAK